MHLLEGKLVSSSSSYIPKGIGAHEDPHLLVRELFFSQGLHSPDVRTGTVLQTMIDNFKKNLPFTLVKDEALQTEDSVKLICFPLMLCGPLKEL